jgi:hypothetical protein
MDRVGHRQTVAKSPASTLAVANVWHNYANPHDVNGRDGVLPLDALLIINWLNAHSESTLPPAPADPPPYYDVNNDGYCLPLDVLLVINYLNSDNPQSPEGEAVPGVTGPLTSRALTLHASAATRIPPGLDGVSQWFSSALFQRGSAGILLAASTDGLSAARRGDNHEVVGGNDSRGVFLPLELGRTNSVPSELWFESPRRASRPVTASGLSADDDGALQPWEDILPDIAPDVAAAWRG